ncbi:M16 family metallopeptidase [Flavisolibacter ginsenosidimutans]|uniref:Insulinase family protein n=1 Tax=Flavisolibacter ginsenosidimutans TaxID=661481 RepID=A0A5B8UIS9_9BACT|nr:pitrilysin family protein [Flavisolibacter ginsenosidimutans]QEC56020.1 insulinase family protein [Flavisolibacter ginsenosidimutans]
MKKLLLLLCAGYAASAWAQPRLPKDYYWQKLDNGLEVVVIENHKVPLATIEIAVKNGAYTEGPEYSGLSHLFEHMFFKANKDYPDQEKFLKRTQELGAIWNGTTGEERVNYFFTFDKDSLEAGLKFMNAAIRFPIYREEDMQKERPVVDGEFQRAESDPSFQLYFEAGKRMWGDLFTRKNPIGDHDIINSATPAKMMVIKDKYYLPNNSLLVVCGDVNPSQAFAMAKNIFGDWKPSEWNPQTKYPIPEFAPVAKTDYFIKESSIAQNPQIMMFWQGPDTRNDSAATVAADVFSKILSLNSSKWTQALRDKGLATAADVGYQTSRYVGPIGVYLTPIPSKLKECYTEAMNQIKHWGDGDYFSDADLATAKAGLKRQKIRQEEKPSSLASQLTYNWASTSLDYMTDYFGAMDKVTRADIQRYIAKYITGKTYVAGMIINKEMNDKYKPSEYFKN